MFTLDIITPQGRYARIDIDSLTLETTDGQRTLLSNHMATVIPVAIGVMYTKTKDQHDEYAVSEGLLTFENNIGTLMVTTIEGKSEIDFERAEKARLRAETYLHEQGQNAIDLERAALALKRSLSRLRLKK